MTDTKPKKTKSRWGKGGERYASKDLVAIRRRLREPLGWRNGAKVWQRPFASVERVNDIAARIKTSAALTRFDRLLQ